MNKKMNTYLNTLLPESKKWITEMEHIARIEHIPIMDPVSMQFVAQLIKIQRPKAILEIGTAIGYSALRMAEACPETKVTTIERDETRFHEAEKNIKSLGKEHQIRIIHGDALETLPELPHESYQMILIDAAKGQYKHFFEHSHPLLKMDGIILSDNVLFRGYVSSPEHIEYERHQNIVKKLQEYNQFISGHPNYSTSIIPIGDGVAVSIKTEGSS